MPSALAGTRSPVCSEESTLVVTAGQPRHRHSLRDGVNGCFVLSPVSVTS
jgi:hypothetical protein